MRGLIALVLGCFGAEVLHAQSPIAFEAHASSPIYEPTRLKRLPTTAAHTEDPIAVPAKAAPDFAALMRPSISLAAEWQPESGGVDLASYDTRISLPTYPVFGPPPPSINFAFSYFDVNAPEALDLPADLYDYSLGFGWMRRINDRWMLRLMFSTALAHDGKNNSRDVWQYRGGMFALYRPNDQWTWILGALALGRNDIPVVPAVGAIWQPTSAVRFDLTLPKPKAAFLLADNGRRQQWWYLGGGFDGGTWAYETSTGSDDQITYRDWRFVWGWESVPTPTPGMPFTRGRKLGMEIGYSFAREFEFDSGRPDIELRNALLLQASASF